MVLEKSKETQQKHKYGYINIQYGVIQMGEKKKTLVTKNLVLSTFS